MHKEETSPKEGVNRTSSPKEEQMRHTKVHMVKDEGVNKEPKRKHDDFKVMPMASEKDSKKANVSGEPYSGKDKETHKAEHQGNNAKGFDENKAPGRGTYSV
jgi:hypothetical protein